jgi:hypothetical protein
LAHGSEERQARGIGSEGVAEFERMPNDPVLQAYLNADEPAKLVYIANYVVENIPRYTMIARIEVARPISPWERSFPSLDKLDPTDKIDRTLKQMVERDKKGVLARYLEITAIGYEPYRDAINMDTAMKFGPGEWMARPGKTNTDLYEAFADLCVARPR